MDLYKYLNNEQAQAASIIEGPILIIAGAGSGKTRMITYRIANMLESGIDERNILALTFTNKAASEMAQRIRDLTGQSLPHLTTTTFHSFGMGLLKQYIQHLGYRNNFTIYDSNDQKALLKQVIIESGYDLDDFNLFETAQLFSECKTRRKHFSSAKQEKLYDEYSKTLKAYNAVDFDDLIMKPIEIFEKFPEILEKVQDRYQYILVDEFQDTSISQYTFVKMIAQKHHNICIVGDDDQSIYSWRGANYKNLVLFEQDFPERKEIKLERNYRSTETILEAANHVIRNNTNRKEKALWTKSGKGGNIVLLHPQDDEDEVLEIINQMQHEMDVQHLSYDRFGILVRTNNLIPLFETTFMSRNIPVQVSGAQSFFDRKEIRDIVSYLKVMNNPDDDINFLRIINTPRRGIGRVTVEKMRKVADERKISMFSAMALMATDLDIVNQPTKEKLSRLLQLIYEFNDDFEHGDDPKHMLLRRLIKHIGYRGYLEEEYPDNEKAVEYRMKGLDLLCGMLQRYERNPLNRGTVGDFINRICLMGKENPEEDSRGKVQLMTMHASKGLEFDTVFLAGIEDNIIPHKRSIEENPDNIYEERRLFYVAITRAMRKLFISTCQKRSRMNEKVIAVPSRFIEEIPQQLFDDVDPNRELSGEEVEDRLSSFLAKLQGL